VLVKVSKLFPMKESPGVCHTSDDILNLEMHQRVSTDEPLLKDEDRMGETQKGDNSDAQQGAVANRQ
jgi:hypothetical protein